MFNDPIYFCFFRQFLKLYLISFNLFCKRKKIMKMNCKSFQKSPCVEIIKIVEQAESKTTLELNKIVFLHW